MRSSWSRALGSLAIGIAIAGCGSSAGPTVAPSATPVATTAPTPTPKPTPDPLALFRDAVAEAGFQASAEMEGSLDVGVEAAITGAVEIDGENVRTEIRVLVAGSTGRPTVTHQLVVDDDTYLGLGEPVHWRVVPEMTGSNRPDTLGEVVAAMRPDPVAGTPGRYRLDRGDAEGLLTALGLLDPSLDFSDPDVEIEIGADGALTVIDASYGASVQAGTIAEWDLVLTFDAAPKVGPMQEPDDLWVAFDPGRVYRLVLPDDWETEVDTDEEFTDFYDAPDGSAEVVAYCAKDTGLDLEQWTEDGIDFYTKEWGSAPTEQPSDATLGGEPATITAWSTADVNGTPSFAINMAAIHGDRSCDLQWFSDPGNEQADAELFGAFVAGFSWSE